jgi:hypothetical protein
MKKSILISLFALRQFVFALVLFMVIGFLIPSQAYATYSVGGDLYAYAGPDGDIVNRSTSGLTASSDSGVSSGSGGAVAVSRYFANLATGSLGTYISGDNPNADEYGGGTAAAEASAYFSDVLKLTIPAGTYDNDLYVTLSGYVNGSLSAFGWNGNDNEAQARYSNVYEIGTFYLLCDGFALQKSDTETYADDSHSVVSTTFSQTFDLTTQILVAGEYLTPRTVNVPVSASLLGKGTALNFYGCGINADESSSMLSDFYSTGGFSSFNVPEGVTWTSDSGVFLIPEPATLLLLGLGSIMLRKCRAK